MDPADSTSLGYGYLFYQTLNSPDPLNLVNIIQTNPYCNSDIDVNPNRNITLGTSDVAYTCTNGCAKISFVSQIDSSATSSIQLIPYSDTANGKIYCLDKC